MAKSLIGVVISNKMQKTVVIKVSRKVKHPLYKKLINKSEKFKAHNELEVQIGDKVKIVETKPISREVYFKVEKIVKNDK
ncbi:30S ribosomal protein S17 [Candidatus Curtissbacteria bacterium]|nr:30S ribosomal protein S17 [Candidatus Curtissbacteria bacterium]